MQDVLHKNLYTTDYNIKCVIWKDSINTTVEMILQNRKTRFNME